MADRETGSFYPPEMEPLEGWPIYYYLRFDATHGAVMRRDGAGVSPQCVYRGTSAECGRQLRWLREGREPWGSL